MLYAHLLHMLRHIKKHVHCPSCQGKFSNRDLDLVELSDEGMLLYAQCPSCQTELELEIGIQGGQLVPHITVSRDASITEEDVKNVTKKLARHKGSITSLFDHSGPKRKKKGSS